MAITNQKELQAWIDLEDLSGNKLGSGPITNILRFKSTKSMDRAGNYEALIPLSDPQADNLATHINLFCYALIGGAVEEIGGGRITEIEYMPTQSGTVARVKGFDLLEELGQRTVQFLALGTSGTVTHSTAISSIASYAPGGWTINADPSPPFNDIIYRFSGESVLQALILMNEYFRTHFRLDANRTINIGHTFTDSGMIAIDAPVIGYAPDDNVCYISQFSYTKEINDIFSRVYPYGGWYNGVFYDFFITIEDSTVGPYAGYTHNRSDNWIQKTDTHTTYGQIDRQVQYPQIKVTFFTGGYSAAIWEDLNNLIYNRAVADLELYSVQGEFYTLQLANCSQILNPLESIRVILNRAEGGRNVIAVDNTFFILESTVELTRSGIRTTDLQIADIDRYMRTDPFVIAGPAYKNQFFNDQH
jgi:hypothetical protein